MALLLRTHLKLARTSIKENRTRSFLTCLGIAIGIASIILILSLMGSISNLVKSEISDLGNDLMVVRPNSTKDTVTDIIDELTTSNSFQKSTLSISDVSTIAKTEGVAAVAPIAVSVNTVGSEKNTLSSTPVLGTNLDFIKIEQLPLRFGAFLNEKNEEKSSSTRLTALSVRPSPSWARSSWSSAFSTKSTNPSVLTTLISTTLSLWISKA